MVPPSIVQPDESIEGYGKRSADNVVLLSIVLLLLAGDMLAPAPATRAVLDWLKSPGLYAPTAAIGGMVGFTELVSRYRDAPWRVAIMLPGVIFIGVNAAASVFALFLMLWFRDQLHTPNDPVLQVILAGTGAMVVVRTKIFTLRQPSGSDIAVGPAFILDTMLSAINREVDRRRAQKRIGRVVMRAARLRGYTYTDAMTFLTASLAAFQNLDAEVSKKLNDDLRQLVTDSALRALTEEVKFLIAGYSILTEFGERAFDSVFTSLEIYLKARGRPLDGATAPEPAAVRPEVLPPAGRVSSNP